MAQQKMTLAQRVEDHLRQRDEFEKRHAKFIGGLREKESQVHRQFTAIQTETQVRGLLARIKERQFQALLRP